MRQNILIFALLFAFTSEARDLVVFHDGKPDPSYDSLIGNVHPGDSIIVEDHGKKTTFRIKSQIYPGPSSGEGSNNIIFETEDGKALRMAATSEQLDSITDYIN